MDTLDERDARLRQAVQWAVLAHPGAVGEYLERELREFLRLGPRLGGGGDQLMWRVVDEIIDKARRRNDGGT